MHAGFVFGKSPRELFKSTQVVDTSGSKDQNVVWCLSCCSSRPFFKAPCFVNYQLIILKLGTNTIKFNIICWSINCSYQLCKGIYNNKAVINESYTLSSLTKLKYHVDKCIFAKMVLVNKQPKQFANSTISISKN